MWHGGRRGLRFAQCRNIQLCPWAQQFATNRAASAAFYSSLPKIFGEAPTNGLPFAEQREGSSQLLAAISAAASSTGSDSPDETLEALLAIVPELVAGVALRHGCLSVGYYMDYAPTCLSNWLPPKVQEPYSCS